MTNDHFEYYREIIPEFAGFQESLRRPFPVHLRGNRLKIEPGRLLKILKEKGIYLKRGNDGDDGFFLHLT